MMVGWGSEGEMMVGWGSEREMMVGWGKSKGKVKVRQRGGENDSYHTVC